MAAFPDGVPCWADAMVPDLEAAERFYGELLGWTFEAGSPEFGNYTEARSEGRRVAAVVPTPAGMTGSPPSWSIYFASCDVDGTARRITAAGGRSAVDPMDVADYGRMMIAQDPEGTFFGVWQAGRHTGFEKHGEPGSYVWATVCVRNAEAADAFYPDVMPLEAVPVPDSGYTVFEAGGTAAAGRLRMDDRFPPETPPHVLVHFGVDDCDRAVETVRRLGGELRSGPADSPFGRLAVVSDQQGAVFAVMDPATTTGERPQ
ncbi:VOC family protein [Streptomyces meridianus]|uniref:VOC family protein n=1 Tax=Streptomyces meridianus TaxID=2938945 RepID=A0ABT0X2L5_9ACTN|nr:VOC family protein [Streptomyces meridianus]MCM2576777.1 VOC family protein [Streptomyces meridianus]